MAPPAARFRRNLKRKIVSFLDTTASNSSDQGEEDQDLDQLNQSSQLQEQSGEEQSGQTESAVNNHAVDKSPRFLASSLAKRKLLLKTERKYQYRVSISHERYKLSFYSIDVATT